MQMFSVELATVKSVDYIDQKIVPTDANEKKVQVRRTSRAMRNNLN